MEPAAGGLSAIGLDWRALLFQLVNFIVLLWLLKRFAYRPVVKLLEARRQKIEESLRTVDEIAHQKTTLEAQRVQRMHQVEQEAAAIIIGGKQAASSMIQAATERARLEADHIRAQAAAQVEQERQALRQAVKAETLGLVKKAAERVLRQKLNAPADAILIEQTLHHFP